MDQDRLRHGAERAFDHLLDFLNHRHGFDFSGYKRTGLMRRVRKRMHALQIDEFEDYQDYLEEHPGEFVRLFNTILINVTGFFRDPQAWQVLATQVLPRIVAPSPRPIRVWSAGCSSGEETYTLVMLLAEQLGWEEFQERVKVYGTDLDTGALQRARVARYGEKAVETVPPWLLGKYFDEVEGKFAFKPELRRQVIFGENDLNRDAPIAHLDLLVCRNTLMYFNVETQHRMLGRFHFALNDGGYLFLGRAEMLLTRNSLFTPHDLKSRIFAKVAGSPPQERLVSILRTSERRLDADESTTSPRQELLSAALETAPVAQLVVDADGILRAASELARTLFRIPAAALDRPLRDLKVSYSPVELRVLIEQAYARGGTVYRNGIEHRVPGGEPYLLDLRVAPLTDGGRPVGVSICYTDVTGQQRVRDELWRRTGELDRVGACLDSVLADPRTAAVVLDGELRVRCWTDRAAELWGLRAGEVMDRPFLALDIGMPTAALQAPLRTCLEGADAVQEVVLEAKNRRGEPFRCRVRCATLPDLRDGGRGVLVTMEERMPLEGPA